MTATLDAPAPTAAPAAAPPRLAWLDALRGLAALVVVWFHASPYLLGAGAHLAVHRHFDLGKYGVLLFFLVSGYVIPMSLERHGSLRRFWTGRLFRIYPAYLATAGLVLALAAAGLLRIPAPLAAEPVVGLLGHLTMLQEFLGLRGLIGPFWTLSYEMAFYLIVAGLFVWRLHRLSAWWAGALALTAALAGPVLPDGLFAATPARRAVTAAALAVLLIVSLVAYLRGPRRAVLLVGALGLGVALLPLAGGHPTRWVTTDSSGEATAMLSVMFAGAVLYRAERRQISRPAAGAALIAVSLAVPLAPYLHTGRVGDLLRWAAVTLAVAASFTLAYALRDRRVPAALRRLGEISYSLYLLHVVVLYVILRYAPDEPDRTIADTVVLGLGYATAALTVARLAHRWVEQPGQRLGRRALRRLTSRPEVAATSDTTPLKVAGRAPGASISDTRASRLDT